MIRLDSCLQLDTRNSFGIPGNIFEDLFAPSEPPTACFGNARSLADTHCEPVSLNKEISATKGNELERSIQNFALPTPRFARKFQAWNPPSHVQGAYPQNCTVEQPRTQVSETHFDKFPDPWTLQCWKTTFTTEVCSCCNFHTEAIYIYCGSRKCIWATQCRKTSQSIGGHRFPNFEMLMRRLRPPWRRSSWTTTSRRESVWRSKRPNTFG